MADPGFPVGGRAPIRGGVDLRYEHFSVKMYAKMKELGPIGGGVCLARPPLDPPMQYAGSGTLQTLNWDSHEAFMI